MIHPYRRWALYLLLPFAIFFSGCDASSLSSDTVFLTHEFSTDTSGQSIRFAFSSDNVSVNRLNDISCNCTLNISDYIESQGFQPSGGHDHALSDQQKDGLPEPGHSEIHLGGNLSN
jgi:hypothetical protein